MPFVTFNSESGVKVTVSSDSVSHVEYAVDYTSPKVVMNGGQEYFIHGDKVQALLVRLNNGTEPHVIP